MWLDYSECDLQGSVSLISVCSRLIARALLTFASDSLRPFFPYGWAPCDLPAGWQ